jgi:hypothetical protein
MLLMRIRKTIASAKDGLVKEGQRADCSLKDV